MTKIAERVASPLGRLLVGETDPAWAREQDTLAARRDAARVTIAPLLSAYSAALEVADWIEVTRIGTELARLGKAEIARKNSTKGAEKATEDIIIKTGIEPVIFHALTQVYATYLGGHRKMRAAREYALLYLKPELFLKPGIFASPNDIPERWRRLLRPQQQRELADRRASILGKLKEMSERPASGLRPLLEKATRSWREAVS